MPHSPERPEHHFRGDRCTSHLNSHSSAISLREKPTKCSRSSCLVFLVTRSLAMRLKMPRRELLCQLMRKSAAREPGPILDEAR